MKCFVWVLFISIAVAGSMYAEWEIETLDSGGCTGYWTSIRLDSEENVHIVYMDDTFESGHDQVLQISLRFGSYTGMGLTSAGIIGGGIAYMASKMD